MSDDGPDPDAWLVTFGDLITLLLTFFVLLLAMSSVDQKKLEEAFEHFGGKPFLLEGGGILCHWDQIRIQGEYGSSDKKRYENCTSDQKDSPIRRGWRYKTGRKCS